MTEQEIVTRRNLPHWYMPGAWHFVTYRLHGTIPQQVLLDLRKQRQTRLLQKPASVVTPFQNRVIAHKQFFAAYDRYLDRTCRIDWLAQPRLAALIRGNLYHHRGSKYHLLAYCVMPNHVHVLFQPLNADGSVATSGPLVSPQARPLAATLDGSVATSGPLVSPQARPLAATLGLTDVSTSGSPLGITSEALVDAGSTEHHELDERADVNSRLAGIMHSWKSYTGHLANKLLNRSGQFWQHESFDHWVRDDEELERIVSYIIWNPVKAGLVQEPHEWFFSSAHDRLLDDGSKVGFLR